LGIPNLKAWLFKHTLVEVCTAIKGFYAKQMIMSGSCDALFYFDPDIVILDSLAPLLKQFESSSILLTPHQLEPEEYGSAIEDNEICSLKHGIYNLGFLGLKHSANGKKFADWWCKRLENYCYDDIPNGLFTDQRWVDLAPAFFEEVAIIRDPGCNVATWNLTHRHVTGSLSEGFKVNGDHPLRFYHFSGFDSGAQLHQLFVYGQSMPALIELRNWYIKQCAMNGSLEFADLIWQYEKYNNGRSIAKQHRRVYRDDPQLQLNMPDPFAASESSLRNRSMHHLQPPSCVAAND